MSQDRVYFSEPPTLRALASPPATTVEFFDRALVEREDLTRKLTRIAAVRIALVTLSLGASIIFIDLSAESAMEVHSGKYTLIAFSYIVSICYMVALRASANVHALSYGQVVVDSILVTWLVLMSGGAESVFNIAYVLVVFGAALTLYRRGAIIGTMTSLLLYGTLVLVQVTNSIAFLPKIEANAAALSFMIYSIGFGLVGALASTLAETASKRGQLLAEKESEFEQLEELQTSILRSLPAGLMTLDNDGTIRYANEAARSILLLRSRQLIGQNLRSVVPAIAEPWTMIVKKRGLIPNPRDRFEGDFLRGDGSDLRLGFSFAPMTTRPGNLSLIVVFQDVTNVIKLKAEVERAERLATVGKLAAGLAHEIRNPLASMCASIDVLKTGINPSGAMKRLMDNVVTEGERLNELIADFLLFAKPRQLNLVRVTLSELVENVLDVYRYDDALKSCEVSMSLDEEVVILADTDAIRQVMWNLVRNATQAMKSFPEARIDLVTRNNGECGEIIIADNGPGIDEDVLARIFDPFYTTKGEDGTGLGLAIVHSIVSAHGGKVLVSSAPQKGTEFVIQLPLAESEIPLQKSEQSADPAYNIRPSQFDILGGPL
ncbi:MAG: ATP-binding protein [Myxococcota bacterium]|nr:ATP-binding protein [Myxococcota bacterium]